MTKSERILRSIARNPGHLPHQIANNLNVSVAEVRAVMETRPTTAPGSSPARTVTKQVKLLKVEFDDVGKVRAFMGRLPKSEYVDEIDLRRELKIAEPRWREVRSHDALANYQYVLPNKKVVWMHKEAQDQLRAAIELSVP